MIDGELVNLNVKFLKRKKYKAIINFNFKKFKNLEEINLKRVKVNWKSF